MNLEQITYGNPTQEQLVYLQKDSFVDILFSDLSKYTFPKNSSDATKEELNAIVDAINTLGGKDEYIRRYKMYDKNLKEYFIEGLVKGGENKDEVTNLVEGIIEDTKPLLNKLKFYFQRPRPFQLAEYYKLKLFPYTAITSQSPSFPSGHAIQGKLLTEVIGNRYPKTYSFMQDVFNEICYSRLYMGLHYQSDIDVGIFCAEKILELKEFKVKYKI